MRSILLVFCALLLSAASPKSEAEKAFDEWLVAFNSNDEEALKTFSAKRLGYSDIAYFRDVRDESGGLDIAEVERNEPLRFVVKMRERESGAFRRVTVVLDKMGSEKLKKLSTRSFALPQNAAIENLGAFAQRMADEDKFSGVVAIKQGDTVLHHQAYGLANRQTDLPVTKDTPFFFASQGKMLTAVSILQLVEAGKLDLNAPLGNYLTDYPNEAMAKVTIRQLLTHTGGTGEMGLLNPKDGANRKTVRTLDDIVALNSDRPPAFDPGSRMDYSNHGFILLGAIIEEVSGQTYYDYVTKNILTSAGMTHTSWPTLDELDGIAIPYTTNQYEFLLSAVETLPWRGSPAGGGVSTASDGLRFIDALRSGKLLSKSLLAEATKPQQEWYGYGFVTGYAGQNQPWGHGGNASGTDTSLYFFPSLDITFACLGNREAVCNKLFQNFAQHMIPPQPIKD